MIRINGMEVLADNQLLSDCLKNNGYRLERVAVAVNGQIVPKVQYSATVLMPGDRVEVVSLVGGGRCFFYWNKPYEGIKIDYIRIGANYMKHQDLLVLGGKEFSSRFILGSGKYSLDLIKAAIECAEAQMITLAVRRTNTKENENI